MMDIIISEEKDKTCFNNWYDKQYYRLGKTQKKNSTTCMMNNIMGKERDKTSFDNLYDGHYQEWGRAERIFEHRFDEQYHG